MYRILSIMLLVAFTCYGQDGTAKSLLDNGRYHERYSGKLDKAAAFYKRALSHEKADATIKTEARLGLAACASRKGHHENAVKFLRDAYADQPEFLLKMLADRGPVGKPKSKKPEELESPLVKKMNHKLETIIIKKIDFDKTNVVDVFQYLKAESKKADPTGAGVNFLVILSPVFPVNPPGDGENFELGDDIGLEEDGDLSLKDPTEEELAPEKRQEPKVTVHLDNVPLGDAVKYICDQLNLYCKVEDYAVVVAEQGALRIDPELRFLPVDASEVGKYVKSGLLDLKNPKPFFESMGVRFNPHGRIAYDTVSNQFIASEMHEVMTQIQTVVKQLRPHCPQVRISAELVWIDVDSKVLARIRPADLAIFIRDLPESRRTTISTMGGRTMSGKELSVSQANRCKTANGVELVRSSLSGTPRIRGDNLTIDGQMTFTYHSAAVADDGKVSADPLWETTAKQSVSVWDGEPIAVQASSPGKAGTAATFVIFEARIIDPIGFPIREQRKPKGGWLKVEGSNHIELQ